jgi:hypothetical protein
MFCVFLLVFFENQTVQHKAVLDAQLPKIRRVLSSLETDRYLASYTTHHLPGVWASFASISFERMEQCILGLGSFFHCKIFGVFSGVMTPRRDGVDVFLRAISRLLIALQIALGALNGSLDR